MGEKFKVEFLEEVMDFLDGLDEKVRTKILFNIDRAKVKNDSSLFKKLTSDIWEFRTLFNKKQYRLFAFWKKSRKNTTVEVATHGIVKKHKRHQRKKLTKLPKR